MRRLVLLPLLVLAACGGEAATVTAPPTGPPRAEELPPPEVRGSGGVAAPGSASLRAGGEQLLPPTDGTLAAVAGEDVEGTDLVVTDTEKLGFFAGTSELQRVFVLWDGDPPAIRTTVDLEGTVRRAGAPQVRGLLLPAPDAAVVAAQGGYVEATEVEAAG